MAAMMGPATSIPSEVTTRSKARFRVREECDSPKARTPSIVIPSRSSNSTEEPTASNMRGSTLTRTPTFLAIRMSSTTPSVSVASGAMTIRWTCSPRTR